MLYTGGKEGGEVRKGGGPEIFAFEKILLEHGFGVGVREEVFGPSALFFR